MIPSDKQLIEDFSFFLKNKKELARQYEGRFIVIKNNKIIGDYGSSIEAHQKTRINYQPETYLVLFCQSDPQVPKIMSYIGVE